MIIDSETHVIYRAWPIETNPTRSRVEGFTWHEHSGDLLADEMAHAGVDRTFLISYDGYDVEWFLRSINTTPEDFITGKKYTRVAIDAHPDKFWWFSTLKDPRVRGNLDAVRDDFDRGAIGLKIFPSFLVLPVDDPSLLEIYKMCVDANRRVILSFEDAHPPETRSVPEFFGELDRVLTEMPDLRVQLNHGGCVDPLTGDVEVVASVVNKHQNVWVSTAMMGLIWDDGTEYPYANYQRRLERLKDAIGVQKMLWGTDWPHQTQYMLYSQAVDAVRLHSDFMDDHEKRLFLGENASQFIGDAAAAISVAPRGQP